jgi:hypothetical protein
MSDIITEKYGIEANIFINQIIWTSWSLILCKHHQWWLNSLISRLRKPVENVEKENGGKLRRRSEESIQ